MRMLMIQPNDHAGGAGIAANWTPGWVTYIVEEQIDAPGTTAAVPMTGLEATKPASVATAQL